MLLDICHGMAAALAHLHAKNIVHGDLNPKNVLLKAGPYAPPPRPSSSGMYGSPAQQQHLLLQQRMPSGLDPLSVGLSGGSSTGGPGAGATSNLLAGRCGFQIKVRRLEPVGCERGRGLWRW